MKGLVSAVVAVAIVVASTLLVVNMISPTLEESKMLQRYNEAKQTMSAIDSVITELLYEAPGAKRSIEVKVSENNLEVLGKEDKIRMKFENIKVLEPGAKVSEGNVVIESGPFLDAYESDVNNDGSTDLVLENDVILFAIKKLGNSSIDVFINTTNMVTVLRLKEFDINITPTTGIYINERENSSYGYGYTELTQQGIHISSAGIRVVMSNATSGNQYDAFLTLGASYDFIELEVKHVV